MVFRALADAPSLFNPFLPDDDPAPLWLAIHAPNRDTHKSRAKFFKLKESIHPDDGRAVFNVAVAGQSTSSS